MSDDKKHNFDHADLVDKIRHEAMVGCGSSYELFSKRFSRSIDSHASKMPDVERQEFMEKAKKGGDYMTEDEENEAFDGCCSHGIDWGFCPAGCDRDDD
ncbi:hypothetical protein [Acetobacter persici]|uniref:hypothetical protein n=1 Tax=Acetobacter persici TaxID=1076596 RepID=UPI001BA99499|nr:hypothetical protein [Acetobacter persici]MBS1017313.1 hypothetical protein [Acetobacter persici]